MVLEIQSRFKKSCMCSCTGFSTLCHTDVASETQEGRRSLCTCMPVCFSMYRCVCECGTCVCCIHKHTGLLAYACTKVKRGHFSLSLSVLISLRQKLAWWPPSPRDLLCLPPTALGLQAYMWPHLPSGSSDIQVVGSHICPASALTDWAIFLAQTGTSQFLPYSI